MKVVVDTNVVVSAIIRDRLPEKIILSIVSHSDIEWIVSRKILHEYRKVLSRPKFGIGRDILEKWSAVFDEATVLIEVPLGITFPRDQDDAMFIECAIASVKPGRKARGRLTLS
ncbi:MAG: putative toxin-antitoxin system toxin component, PIN family [Spirochaetes bacterium]|nr:putative toxin-antitoxin system toxin component, PIN family [Spirochaetota bacterium]